MRSFVIIAVVSMCSFAAWPAGAALIDVGTHTLQPNQPNQLLTIDVTGGEQVQGVDFFLQVADGGPEAGGTIDGPAIVDADIFTGTIFATNNTGEAGGGSLVPQFWQSGTSTNTGTVAAEGLLATVTIDTTGFSSGSWELRMENTIMGDSSFPTPGVTTEVFNGTISILVDPPDVIPEPSTALIALFLGGVSLICRQVRRRRC